jgi:raffinose/stachyose/melibiose transport system substrate-binding protein
MNGNPPAERTPSMNNQIPERHGMLAQHLKAYVRVFVFLAIGAACLPTAQPETPSPVITPATATPSFTPSPYPFTATPTETPEPVTIQWWGIDPGEPQEAEMLIQADAFGQSHPHVTVQLTILDRDDFNQQIAAALESDNPPSLFQNEGDWRITAFADTGLIRDISTEFDAAWQADFLQAPLDRFVYDGKQYGLPRDGGPVGIWYNKSLFQQAGISQQTPNTWEELLSVVQRLKGAGILPIALGEAEKWSGAFWWEYLALRLGGLAAIEAAISRQGAFTDPPFVQAGEELGRLIALHPFPAGFLYMDTYPGASTLFGDGVAAMHLMGYWEKDYQRRSSSTGQGIGADLGWFPFPAVAGGAGNPAEVLGGVYGWLIGADAPAETVEFLKYITSEEEQCQAAGLGMLPATAAAGGCLQDPHLTTLWQAMQQAGYLQIYYDVLLPPATGAKVNDAVAGLFAGTITPENAARKIEDTYALEVGG